MTCLRQDRARPRLPIGGILLRKRRIHVKLRSSVAPDVPFGTPPGLSTSSRRVDGCAVQGAADDPSLDRSTNPCRKHVDQSTDERAPHLAPAISGDAQASHRSSPVMLTETSRS